MKMKVTPEMATEWLSKNKINRPVLKSNVKYIANEIKKGNNGGVVTTKTISCFRTLNNV